MSMGIYLPKMEIPENCWSCKMFCNCYACEGYDCHCAALGEDTAKRTKLPRNKRRDDCPLVPVPTHGRLGDLDNLRKKFETICDRYDAGIISEVVCMNMMLQAVISAPTIIPAETAEEAKDDAT